MDDTLQSRLDRLTALVAVLLAAVLAIGYVEAGAFYLFVFVTLLVGGGLVTTSLLVITADLRRESPDDGA